MKGYRQRVGLFTRPSVGVVVQTLLDSDIAGVMFTQNPVTSNTNPANDDTRSFTIPVPSMAINNPV